jgi:hypothetical protein
MRSSLSCIHLQLQLALLMRCVVRDVLADWCQRCMQVHSGLCGGAATVHSPALIGPALASPAPDVGRAFATRWVQCMYAYGV